MELTKVIFRKFRGGDVIALFPQEMGGYDPRETCLSYMHVGQHGSASVNISLWTFPAKPEEYKDLLEELINIGYALRIAKRFSSKDLESRIELCANAR